MIEHITAIDPKIEQAIGQYRRVVGAFNELFGEISLRTFDEEWKSDGVGSCNTNVADTGIEGLVGHALLVARREKNSINNLPRVEGRFTCPYHRANYGCAVGDLKPPVCVSHIENKDEVRKRFGINYFDFKYFVYGVLRRLQFSRVDELEQIHPADNEGFVQDTVDKIKGMTEYIKSFPLAGEPNRSMPVFVQPEYA